KRIGKRLGSELQLPVYLYENSAPLERRRSLPEIRKGGFERLQSQPLEGEWLPDFGPAAAHPTAGAAVVGARGPLIAFNVNLHTTEISVAKRIAAQIRKYRDALPELAGVRALGLYLPSRGIAQISMNLTRPDI